MPSGSGRQYPCSLAELTEKVFHTVCKLANSGKPDRAAIHAKLYEFLLEWQV